jgi:hypothetical protein
VTHCTHQPTVFPVLISSGSSASVSPSVTRVPHVNQLTRPLLPYPRVMGLFSLVKLTSRERRQPCFPISTRVSGRVQEFRRWPGMEWGHSRRLGLLERHRVVNRGLDTVPQRSRGDARERVGSSDPVYRKFSISTRKSSMPCTHIAHSSRRQGSLQVRRTSGEGSAHRIMSLIEVNASSAAS